MDYFELVIGELKLEVSQSSSLSLLPRLQMSCEVFLPQ